MVTYSAFKDIQGGDVAVRQTPNERTAGGVVFGEQ